ncbi:hypothetical protein IMZ48_02485 [Candidatus Bathyarchaeota archaeon]|nr:hypothetical protein [Candidatus Bathyarchaeota archaeon]
MSFTNPHTWTGHSRIRAYAGCSAFLAIDEPSLTAYDGLRGLLPITSVASPTINSTSRPTAYPPVHENQATRGEHVSPQCPPRQNPRTRLPLMHAKDAAG